MAHNEEAPDELESLVKLLSRQIVATGWVEQELGRKRAAGEPLLAVGAVEGSSAGGGSGGGGSSGGGGTSGGGDSGSGGEGGEGSGAGGSKVGGVSSIITADTALTSTADLEAAAPAADAKE
jgi:hypothetical protein